MHNSLVAKKIKKGKQAHMQSVTTHLRTAVTVEVSVKIKEKKCDYVLDGPIYKTIIYKNKIKK